MTVKSTTTQPATPKPVAQKPVVQKPVAQKPVAQKPAAPILDQVKLEAPRPTPRVPLPADPHASVEVFKKAVETSEGNVKIARTNQAAATTFRGQVDTQTQARVNQAQDALQRQDAAAIVPVNEAKLALEAKRKALQAPIDQTQDKLGKARWDLEIATHPNKVELDKDRSDAHTAAQERETALGQQQRYVDEVTSALGGARRDLSSNRSGLAGAERERAEQSSRLAATQSALGSARWGAPSSYELDSAYSRLNTADREYRAADDAVDNAQRVVTSRRSHLNTLLDENNRPTPPSTGSDRPTPPSTSDRPTPPAAGGRPTPPSATDRPTPPGTSTRPTPPSSTDRPTPPAVNAPHTSSEISQARTDLSAAERELTRAESRLASARSELDVARRSYQDKKGRADQVAELEHQVATLQRDVQTLDRNIGVYRQNVHGLEGQINELEGDLGTGTRNRDQAREDLEAAQAHARKLDATPYAQGEPAKIKGAQGKVDGLERTLSGHQQAYESGMKPPTERLQQAQKTYEGTMAPYRTALGEAQQGRTTELGAADRALQTARSEMDQANKDYQKVKDVPGGRSLKWKAPKWLGGSGFNADDYLKSRPAP